MPQTQQYPGEPDGPPALSFLDVMRGWIAWWDATDDETKIIDTRDGGQHWHDISHQPLQRIQMVNDSRGYGIDRGELYRTNDGGRSWLQTKTPHIAHIDRLFFLTPELGWIEGVDENDLFVFRTVDGGRDWQESRSAAPPQPASVRDLFFLDQQRGWLLTWGYNDEGSYLYSTIDGGQHWTADPDQSFQGKGKFASVVRFTSKDRGFVFVDDNGQSRIVYTTDGGTHWYKHALPRLVSNCQVFEGDLLCSAVPGFHLLTVHPK